ncbi:hypothetical protein J6590_037174 [Homalodisca vitripennis]|nr:hypothetical protein J6590_037174 [Homalodisca vitripennis]
MNEWTPAGSKFTVPVPLHVTAEAKMSGHRPDQNSPFPYLYMSTAEAKMSGHRPDQNSPFPYLYMSLLRPR